MPLTPLHFGPAIALKALMPAYFSLSVFILSQVLIDLEPLYFIITNQPPLHRFFHTYLGAGIICLICIVIGKPVGQWWIRWWNKSVSPGHHSRLHGKDKIPFKAVVIAGIIGAFSHVLLDSIMYDDVHPLAPWSELNPMLGVINLLTLHFGLIAIGTVGAFWLILMVLVNRFK
ncbi:MAG: DUF4184 family protein [Gammaproteobacteria bacterium]|jgi:hypothetical protein|nr:DUF4184 family protein [Gammaproteobacteria bacterium]